MRAYRTLIVASFILTTFVQTNVLFAVSQSADSTALSSSLTSKTKEVIQKTEASFKKAVDTLSQKKFILKNQAAVTAVETQAVVQKISLWQRLINSIATPLVPLFTPRVESFVDQTIPETEIGATGEVVPVEPIVQSQVKAVVKVVMPKVLAPTIRNVAVEAPTSEIAKLRAEMLALDEATRQYARDLEDRKIDSLTRSMDRSLSPVIQQVNNFTNNPIVSNGSFNFSETVEGLEYAGGVLSTTVGYTIPLTASTTEWSTFYQTPSTRITAGANLAWTGNTLGFSGVLPVASGGTATTTVPSYGQLLVGNGVGGYNLISTSSLGITAGGSGTVGSGTAGQLPYYAAGGTTLSATSTLFLSALGNFGVGETSPTAKLQIKSSTSGSGSNAFRIQSAGSADRLVYRDDGRLWLGTGAASYNALFNLDSSSTQTEMQFTTNATGRTSTDGSYLMYSDSIGFRYLNMENKPHVFYINGTEVARFSETGAIMQITGTLAAQYSGGGSSRGGTLSLISSAGTPQDWYMAVAGTDNAIVNGRSWFLYDNTNSVARFFVDTNGNVGAGLGSTAATARFHARSTSYPAFRGDYDTSNYFIASTTSTGLTIFDAIGTAPAFSFSDNVGIGTTTPSAKLDVWGNLNVGTSSVPALFVNSSTGSTVMGTTTAIGRLTVSNNASVGIYAEAYKTNVDVYGGRFKANLQGSGGGYYSYGVYSEAEAQFDANGSYGVYGKSIGNYSLAGVYGTADAAGAGVHGYSNSSTGYAVRAEQANVSGYALHVTGGKNYIENNLGIGTTTPGQKLVVVGNAQFTAVTSGAYASDLNITANGTLTTSASDIRLKENITEISTSTLDRLNALKAYTFSWKTDPDHRLDVGLIAQEVEFVFPELVFTNKTDGFKGVNYSRLSIFLLKGIQEQQIQLDELKKYTAVLKLKELHTEKLCVGTEGDELCITKEDLQNLLQTHPVSNNSSGGSTGGLSAPTLSTDQEPTDTGSSTPTTGEDIVPPSSDTPTETPSETPVEPASEPTQPDPTPVE